MTLFVLLDTLEASLKLLFYRVLELLRCQLDVLLSDAFLARFTLSGSFLNVAVIRSKSEEENRTFLTIFLTFFWTIYEDRKGQSKSRQSFPLKKISVVALL